MYRCFTSSSKGASFFNRLRDLDESGLERPEEKGLRSPLLRAEFNGIIYPEDANTFIALKKRQAAVSTRERDSI